MSHHDSCSSDHGNHHHHHNCCQCGPECHCPCHKEGDDDGECDFASQLIEAADDAWMEVLKDKIKQQVEKTSGKQLDQLAKVVAEANKARWKHKMAKEKGIEDFQEQIAKILFHE